MLNWILSILVQKKIISEEEATHLGKELPLNIHPQTFTDAHEVVTKLLDDFKKNK